MDFINSLSQFEIAGLLLLGVTVPFLVMGLRRLWWAKESVHWPKVNGIVVKGLHFPRSKIMDFLYTYDVNKTTYTGTKPYFANSFKNLSQKKSSGLMEKYSEGTHVIVHYNPSNHRIATLEPGRKDGVPGAIGLLLFFILLGLVAYFYPTLLTEIIDSSQNIVTNI